MQLPEEHFHKHLACELVLSSSSLEAVLLDLQLRVVNRRRAQPLEIDGFLR
jgi:hypothetical protein